MKTKILLLILTLSLTLFSACTNPTTPTPSPTPTPTTTPGTTTNNTDTTTNNTDTTTPTPDVVTTASIVDTPDAFIHAISKDGTWIICLLKDLTIDQDLVLDGEFTNGKTDDNGNPIIQRKIALYSQDENRNITARYTLTAPKLTVNSPKASIQHGTFKGDLYVSVNDFKLVDATVDGNIYFTTDEAQSTFTMDDTSTVTGTQQLKTQ